jgi:predicted dehydrogenase
MQRPLHVGVIGANSTQSWAKDSHIPALQSLSGVELTAVATTRRETAKAAARTYSLKDIYDDGRLLATADGVDIVSICVKVPHHRDLAMAALSAGKHVYCEWPLGINLAEAEEMAKAAGLAGVHVAIGLQGRMNAAARQAADMIREGAIGRPLSARIYSSTAGFAPSMPSSYAYLNDIESGANVVTILGGHTLDLVIAVLGRIDTVDALLTTQFEEITITDKDETVVRTAPDHLLINARIAGGCAMSLEISGHRSPEMPFSFEIFGTDGKLVLIGGDRRGFQAGRLGLTHNERVIVRAADDAPALPSAAVNVAAMYAALRDDIRSERRSTPDFLHAARLTRLIADVVAAAHEGKRRFAGEWPRSLPGT